MTKILQFVFLLVTLNSFGQNIEILKSFEDSRFLSKPSEFYFLDKKLDSLNSMKIATIKGVFKNSKKTNLSEVFASLWKFSNSMGANSYRIESKSLNINQDSSFVVLSIYFTSPSFLQENFNLYPKNNIYIIGSLNFNSKTLSELKANNKYAYIGSLEYIGFQNLVGETMKINIGGVMGTTIKIIGNENKDSEFFSTSGISVRPGYNFSQIGLEINSGKFYKVETNFGYFLIEFLNKSYKLSDTN